MNPTIELRAFRADTTLYRSVVTKIVERRRAWREAPAGGCVCITRTAYRRVWGWLWWRKCFGATVMLAFAELPDPVLEQRLSRRGLQIQFMEIGLSTTSSPLAKWQRGVLALVY